jgi:hypothetical protein
MTGRLNWTRQQHRHRPHEKAAPKGGTKGAWTHIAREPVKRLTREEIAALLAARPDLLSGGSRTHARPTEKNGGLKPPQKCGPSRVRVRDDDQTD